MATSSAVWWTKKYLLWLVLAVFAVAIGFAVPDYELDPVEGVQGTITSTQGIPNDDHPTRQEVWLRLSTGEVVYARTEPGIIGNVGDTAFANSHRPAPFAKRLYEVVRLEHRR